MSNAHPRALAEARELGRLFATGMHFEESHTGGILTALCESQTLPQIAGCLKNERQYRFATLVVRRIDEGFELSYWFYHPASTVWVKLRVALPPDQLSLPSVSEQVHAADWHERQAEDLFGLNFTGHPKLGDFVLHEEWPEGVNPMLPDFSATDGMQERVVDPAWHPEPILHAPGAFLMPIGPVYSDYAESAQFFLETVGEDAIRIIPRFFFKYRGVEKLAEGRSPDQVLLMVERFSGTSAVGHATAFCRALESIAGLTVPPRGAALRLILAELERLRHHFGVLSDICHATGMIVPSADIDVLEEEALRVSGDFAGHRFLYGLIAPGGLMRDFSDSRIRQLSEQVDHLVAQSRRLFEHLQFTSSFLDRFEGLGVISEASAESHGLVGPVARASGVRTDLRCAMPYDFYRDGPQPAEALEEEGDGYARIRVLFAEVQQAAELIRRAVANIESGPVRTAPDHMKAGEALGWAEAPKGAAFHYVNVGDDQQVVRLQLATPSFTNWHGFHLAAERCAFQDFPLMMASFGLSIAESDR